VAKAMVDSTVAYYLKFASSQNRQVQPSNPPRKMMFKPNCWDHWCRKLMSGWLVNVDPQQIIELSVAKLIEYQQVEQAIVSAEDPIALIAQFIAASSLELPIFLADARWSKTEWLQVEQLAKIGTRSSDRGKMMIPTGGSTGKLRFAVHTWETLGASVAGFQSFYQVQHVNSVCALPLHHVSGLMQLMRSLLTNGRLFITNYQQLQTAPQEIDRVISIPDYFISLVPTQLQRTIDLHPHWLSGFRAVLLGGAPATTDLLATARSLNIPLALTYGMTETGSQICSLKPDEFLAGNNTCGRVLPHAEVNILTGGRDGEIEIKSKSLMLGYYPNDNLPIDKFYPDDLGNIDRDGYLSISGRSSDKIITGGEKVFASEVIEAIERTELVADVSVVGIPDPYWGQAIVAVYVPIKIGVSRDLLAQKTSINLSKYKLPKYWIETDKIHRNSLGKISLSRLQALIDRTIH
jgi:o-succinylbenzoate---CoA ligase